MTPETPLVSAVIPAYNQARYLSSAIESVLAQSFRDFEVVVVDDGSTDDTPLVAQKYGSAIRYVCQENRGLAGARNTGIRCSRGEYVALLDCDDEWMPSFLADMTLLAGRHSEADAFYCGWRYIDADGNELPQRPNTRVVPSEMMYSSLVRGNFLNACTVVLRRSAVVDAALFDDSLRRLEDWDMWLRLLRGGHAFVGIPDCLVRYRLHGSSLSTNRGEMQRSVLRVIEKLFGRNDGRPEEWTEEKRLAYGGGYRYCALTSVLRGGDWEACAGYLLKALRSDPSLAEDVDLFYELALGTQPLGHRGTMHGLSLTDAEPRITAVLASVFNSSVPAEVSRLRNRTRGTAYYALGLVAHDTSQFQLCRRFLLAAPRFRPELAWDRRFAAALAKSVGGRSNTRRLRAIRHRVFPVS